MRRIALIITLSLLGTDVLAETVVEDTPPAACVSFARPFYLIARNRDRGVTKASAMSNFKHNKNREDDADPNAPENWMATTVTTVYNYPNVTPDELQNRALKACSVDATGKIQFKGL
ncbi:hypothetical protein [Dyella sp. GSA-30]|uniref:hypothetical protein n=1 Tax=Dyella sp. GSA-30 TaxID=2994496 RepID=UPI0024929FB8|nr:hypothetical protein [Dyella sp. GSA-30]BDU22414.1 hypothetical protein DYGSA30_38710 [Dyella sp. GSA-30]